MLRFTFLLATGAAMAPGSAGAHYWENGDFRLPVVASGSFAAVDLGERYGSWRVVGEPGMVAWTSGTYTHNGFAFPASGTDAKTKARNWVNLAAISRTATGVMHGPVPTKVGASYTLSFYVGNIVDPSGVYGAASTVLVYENSKFLGRFTNSSGTGTNTENWQLFSVEFAADAPYTEIAFINGDGPDDMNCGLDDVKFGPTPQSSKIAGDLR